MKQVLIALLRVYRFAISPMFGQTCRYYPSCSAYAIEALQVHGAVRGSWLAVKRVARCHPWTPGGVDHVPPRKPERTSPRRPSQSGTSRANQPRSL